MCEWPEVPSQMKNIQNIDVSEERPTEQHSMHVFVMEKEFKLHPSNWSNWNKLIRRTAYVMRFIYNCKRKKEVRELNPDVAQEELKKGRTCNIETLSRRSIYGRFGIIKKNKYRIKEK